MMKIQHSVLGMCATNTYYVYDDETKRGLIVDPVDSPDTIIAKADSLSMIPEAILITHGHFDHIGGNAEFETSNLSKADREVDGEHSDYNALRKMIDNYEEKNVLVRYLFKLKKYKKLVEDSLHIKSVEY